MNVVGRAIALVYQRVQAAGGTAAEADVLALGVAMLVLRGGRALEAVIQADMHAWRAVHGQPGRQKLEHWASGVDIEAGIATQALRLLRP
jgi:hypothetical protein